MGKLKTVGSLVKESFSEWSNDKCPRLGAALSYYTIFSLAPLLLLVVSIAGLAFGREAAEGRILGELSGMVGTEAAETIQTAGAKANKPAAGIIGLVLGFVALLFGATGVVVELQDALNTVWKVVPKPGRGIKGMIRTRLLSLAMIAALGFLLLVSLVVSALLAGLTGWLRGVIGDFVVIGWIADIVISLAVVSSLIALMYKILPEAKVAWRDVWVGAGVTAFLFLLGKYLISVYIGQASVGSAFGAAGSLAVLLVWIYYSAQIILLGAELTRVYANRFGEKVVPTPQAMPAAEAAVKNPPPHPTASPSRV
jgi:membrane protein